MGSLKMIWNTTSNQSYLFEIVKDNFAILVLFFNRYFNTPY